MNKNKKFVKSKKYRRPSKTADEAAVAVKQSKFYSDNVTDKSYNDWSWYAKNQQMLKDAASLSYNRPLGAEIKLSRIIDTPVKTASATFNASSSSIAGIMDLVVCLCPGLSEDYTSPINLAAQNIYSYVRYQNSGGKNYEPADLMFYILSMDSAYALWNTLKRIYGLARSYSQKNWYYPRAFIEGMGVDFDDVMNNLADFRLFINTMGSRLQSFCVPAVMPLLIRHSWMFANVWKDSNNDKAQCYQFIPAYFYQYSEQTTGGGSLNPISWIDYTKNNPSYDNQWNPVLKKFQDIVIYTNQIINSLSKSEDIGVMSGDILKAYGQDKLFKLTPVDADFTVEPTYSEEVLNQIHNATILKTPWVNPAENWNLSITQNVDSQTIVFNPTLPSHGLDYNGAVINMPWDDVTPENTMVGTRLTFCYKRVGNQTKFTALGTEFICNAFMAFHNYATPNDSSVETERYSYNTLDTINAAGTYGNFPVIPNKDTFTKQEVLALVNNYLATAYQGINKALTVYSLKAQFDWAPLSFPVPTNFEQTPSGAANVTTYNVSAVSGDMANWTIVDAADLAQMHLTAVMSEFNIPQIGSF